MSPSPLRIAVIGAGNHSALHHGSALKLYAASHPGDIDLAAVCDLDAAKAEDYARQFGFARTYVDYRAMLERERLDALVAVTPVSATATVAADLLPRGIPLVIEKPTGESAADARRLLAIARQHGAPHMVSFNRRYIPAIARAREWLARQGPERAPRLVVGRMLRPARTELGFVTGTGIHLIDTVLSFMGAPRKVVTCRAPTPLPDRWLSNALLDFGGGASASVVIAPQVGAEEETLEILGQGYAIEIDTCRCSIRIIEGQRETLAWQAPADAPYALACGSLDETAAFVAAARRRSGFSPDLADSLRTMVTAEAIEAGGELAIPAQAW